MFNSSQVNGSCAKSSCSLQTRTPSIICTHNFNITFNYFRPYLAIRLFWTWVVPAYAFYVCQTPKIAPPPTHGWLTIPCVHPSTGSVQQNISSSEDDPAVQGLASNWDTFNDAEHNITVRCNHFYFWNLRGELHPTLLDNSHTILVLIISRCAGNKKCLNWILCASFVSPIVYTYRTMYNL